MISIKSHRVVIVGLLALLLVLHFRVFFDATQFGLAIGTYDFGVYYRAATLLKSNPTTIYDVKYDVEMESDPVWKDILWGGYVYNEFPWLAVMISPLTLASYYDARIIWAYISLVSAVGAGLVSLYLFKERWMKMLALVLVMIVPIPPIGSSADPSTLFIQTSFVGSPDEPLTRFLSLPYFETYFAGKADATILLLMLISLYFAVNCYRNRFLRIPGWALSAVFFAFAAVEPHQMIELFPFWYVSNAVRKNAIRASLIWIGMLALLNSLFLLYPNLLSAAINVWAIRAGEATDTAVFFHLHHYVWLGTIPIFVLADLVMRLRITARGVFIEKPKPVEPVEPPTRASNEFLPSSIDWKSRAA